MTCSKSRSACPAESGVIVTPCLPLAAQEQARVVVGRQIVAVAGRLDRRRDQRRRGVRLPLRGADPRQHRLGARVAGRQLERGFGAGRGVLRPAQREQQIRERGLSVGLARLIDDPVLVDRHLVGEADAGRLIERLRHVAPQLLLELDFAAAEGRAERGGRRHAVGVLLQVGRDLALALRAAQQQVVHQRPRLGIEDAAALAFVVERRAVVDGQQIGERDEALAQVEDVLVLDAAERGLAFAVRW